MNILHITPSCYPATYWGGPIFTVYAMNKALSDMPDVALTTLSTDAAGPLISQRLNQEQLSGLYPNQKIVMTRRIAGASISLELLRRLPMLIRRADVVHLTSIYSFPVLPTFLLCRLLRKPLVCSPHGAIQDAHEWSGTRKKHLKRIWERVCNVLLREGHTVIHVTAEREREPTQNRLPKATTMLVPHGIEIPPPLPSRVWMPKGKLRLIYLGRLDPKKGLENLLHAMAQLNDPNISLSIYGSGNANYTDHLQRLATELGVMNHTVFFMGQVAGNDKTQALHQADVCIVPSYTESFCMVVAEALAHGTPVIASYGTPWARVEEKHCGLWTDNTPEALTQAIKQIRTMELAKMGEQGKLWMAQEFSWNNVADSMLAIYKQLVK